MAVLHPDGRVDVPVTVRTSDGLIGDGGEVLRPGDDGYTEVVGDAIPVDRHPLLGPADLARDAQLEALFRAWDADSATA